MRDFPDFVDIYFVCQPSSAVLPDISLILLSIRSYLELAILREDFSSVVSVNVRFSWVFYFVFICCYKLNLPHNEMRTGPGLFSLGAFPTFRSHGFHHWCLYVESSKGGRGRLKRFVTIVAWKFLKISCFFSFCRSVVGTCSLAPSATSGPLILQVLRKIWESCSLISPNLNLQDHFLASIYSISEKKSFDSRNIPVSIAVFKTKRCPSRQECIHEGLSWFCMYASIQLFFHTFHSFRYLLDHIWSWQFFERIFVCGERKRSIFVSVLFCFYLLRLSIKLATLHHGRHAPACFH